ncbi:hypothetical protein BDN72DRAFT_956746 [Pluteus cervinus]|uniref:Uncharacterized protein n=1 Tax=Pluteus cervinus TaxID=181527 RepID=A0ACD3B640_9AGAR|nr:hypothetical protein BDN72DRAFT_956746 [Pluteus cervinus]
MASMVESRTSAQAHVLRIPELLSRIFNSLSLPVSTLEDVSKIGNLSSRPTKIIAPKTIAPALLECHQRRSSLLAAALTCRAFSAPALNSLWEVMNSLAPLICLLPLIEKDGADYVLLQNSTSKMWEKVAVFAARIRVFIYSDDSLYQKTGLPIHPSGYNVLVAFQPVLLPRLKTLLVRSCLKDSFAYSSLYFASPLLERLETGTLDIGAAEHETFILTVGCRSDRLRHLSFGYLGTTPLGFSAFKTLLTAKIQTLGIRAPLTESLIAASELPALEALAIWGTGSPPYLGSVQGFPVLRKLTLRGDADPLLRVLKACIGKLEAVTLIVTSGSNGGIKHITNLIVERWSESLRHFTLNLQGVTDSMDFTALFRSLFGIKLLSFRVLDFPGHLTSSILDVASIFPMIHTLHLPRSSPDNTPTFAQLYALTEICPDLRSLMVSFDVNSLGGTPSFPPTGHQLDSLIINHSPITAITPRQVAFQLDRVFPYLRNLTSIGLQAAEWEEVLDVLGICHQARRNV